MFDEGFVNRFHQKYTRGSVDQCWEWQGSLGGKGYGQIKLTGQNKLEYAHRASYILSKGEIPSGKYVCHSCDNMKCVNPAHLWLGDSHENHLDMVAKDRHLYGERNGQAVLSEQDVKKIHEMLADGVSQARAGRAMGVSQATVWKISKGHRWGHLSTNTEQK